MKAQACELHGTPEIILAANWPGCVEAAQSLAAGLCNAGLREVWLQEAEDWVDDDTGYADSGALAELSAMSGESLEGWSWADAADAAHSFGSASLAEAWGARALESPSAPEGLLTALAFDEESSRALVVQQRSLCSLLSYLGLPAQW